MGDTTCEVVYMLPAVSQTLANILVHDTSLSSTECISFNPPGDELTGRPGFHIYCYSILEHVPDTLHPLFSANHSPDADSLRWFDICFVVIAQDHTALGKHQLLSEALLALLKHQFLEEDCLAPELRGYGQLSMTIAPNTVINPSLLWQSLGVPIRPALYVTMTVPFKAMRPTLVYSHPV